MRYCSKPGCVKPAAALLGYDYTSRLVLLEDSSGGDVSPHAYVMCSPCADGLRLPRGWMLEDRRTRPPLLALPN